MPATKGRIATETSVSGRSSLTILTIAIMIQIRPSKISMPAKPRISQIRSTSSRTRARSSPVLFLSKYSTESRWTWRNRLSLIWLATRTLLTSNKNSLMYWNRAFAAPIRRKAARYFQSSSILWPTSTSSTMCSVTSGASISRKTLKAMEPKAKT